MEMYGKIRCVTYAELVGSGILSKPSYDKKVREGVLQVVQRGGNGRVALIGYDSLPYAIQQDYLDRHPNAEKEMKEKMMSSMIRSDSEAIDFYKTYEPRLTPERQAEYVLNAQVMNEMARVEKETVAAQRKNGKLRKGIIWEIVAGSCEKMRSLYEHTLPSNPSRLREKFNAYKRDSYVALINRNSGNQAARRIGPKEARLLIMLKRSKSPVYTDMQIFAEFNRQAEVRGLKRIKSAATVRNFLYDPKVMVWWYASQFGEVKFKNKYLPQFDTIMPEMPNSLWYSDGTKLNLYYKGYNADGRQVARTINVYEVMDAATEVFLGYDICKEENFQSQYNAYRMALETWQVKPYEIVTDNQGGHKKLAAQGFFKKICHLHKYTMPHNGQSKTIESAFGRFQQQVLHKIWHFTGQNVTAVKENSHVNVDLITANIDKLPTLEEVKEMYRQCRDEWNNSNHTDESLGLTRIEMQRMIENPKACSVDEYELADLFMLFSKTSVKYSNEGYAFDIDKQEYRYMVYNSEGTVDMSFHLQNICNSFYYRFDPRDMTHIELWAVTSTGLKYAAIATPKVKIHRATQERTEEENRNMYSQLAENRRTRALMQIAAEELVSEERMGEAYTALAVPRPVGLSKTEMEDYQTAYEKGKAKVPIPFPDGCGPEAEPLDMGFSSVGEYTKTLSELTLEELALEKF